MKRFPSLKNNREFQYVYKNGSSFGNRLLVMYVVKSGDERNRIGISVSKKVGNSVVRHHITRMLREIFRLNNDKIETGLNIIIVAERLRKNQITDIWKVRICTCADCITF